MAEDMSDQTVEYHLVTIFEKLELLRKDSLSALNNTKKVAMQVEIRTLEFWRAVTSECLSSFLFVFVVCGAVAGAGVGSPFSSLSASLAAGFAMTFITQFFGHVSGAHVNPSVSIAMGIIKRISVLRTAMFVLAQCGGGIAGAAFLYGVSGNPGYQGNWSAAVGQSALSIITPWERFGVEFILTFIVVYSYFVSMDTYRRWIGTSSITIGSTYSACYLVFTPHLNPARSLGPSFVLNNWDNHWVYWLGPVLGGTASALMYEFIFNPTRQKRVKETPDEESSSIRSEEDLNYDEFDKPKAPKFHGSTYNTYRSTTGIERTNYCASLYSAPPTKLERVESLYGGTKSLYCKSPALTRANLNRSQSVYTKSNTAVNRDVIPKPGPLVPAQSLYPMRLNQQSHVQNQNVQNQLQQRAESYGFRGGVVQGTATRTENYATTERANRVENFPDQRNFATAERQRRDNYAPTESSYGTRTNPSSSESGDTQPIKQNRRPESVYGMVGSQGRNFQQKPGAGSYSNGEGRSAGAQRSQPPPQMMSSTASTSSSYHHQHSPNSQY